MTDEQRDELNRLRLKTCTPEMVTVPKELLDAVTQTAKNDSLFTRSAMILANRMDSVAVCVQESESIAALRKAAGFDTYARKSYGSDWGTSSDEVYAGRATDDILKADRADQ